MSEGLTDIALVSATSLVLAAIVQFVKTESLNRILTPPPRPA